VLRGMRPGSLEDFEGAHDVALEVGARVLDRVADPGLGGEVNHEIRLELLEDRQDAAGGLDVVVDDGEAGVLQQHRLAALLEPDVVVIGEVVDADDLEPVGQQALAEVESDEARGTGDENALGHRASFRPWRTRRAPARLTWVGLK
jgi:hypothetical protein